MLQPNAGNSLDAPSGPADSSLCELSPAGVRGALDLAFHACNGETFLDIRRQSPPLKVVRAFRSGGIALAHLQNVSGGVLGGDRLDTEIVVGEGARAQITTTGATRLYRSRCGDNASLQRNVARVASGGVLEWLPDSLIPFAGSRSRIETSIDLEPDAGLFWWEILAPGRVAHEELFAYDWLDVSFTVNVCGEPVAAERYRIEPAARSVASMARMGPYRYLTTFYICRAGQPAPVWQAIEDQLRVIVDDHSAKYGDYWGASALPAHGVVVKGLSSSALRIHEGLTAAWTAAKTTLYGEAPIPPRKTL